MHFVAWMNGKSPWCVKTNKYMLIRVELNCKPVDDARISRAKANYKGRPPFTCLFTLMRIICSSCYDQIYS